jgi:hypothetical protein
VVAVYGLEEEERLRGANQISESMAAYSSLMVMKKNRA